jgi:hypothetical protein
MNMDRANNLRTVIEQLGRWTDDDFLAPMDTYSGQLMSVLHAAKIEQQQALAPAMVRQVPRDSGHDTMGREIDHPVVGECCPPRHGSLASLPRWTLCAAAPSFLATALISPA